MIAYQLKLIEINLLKRGDIMSKIPTMIGFKADEEYMNMIKELVKYFEEESRLNLKISSSDVLRYAIKELYEDKILNKKN